jgi:hypothetical protein
MRKFTAKYQREFEVEIEAKTTAEADVLARGVLAQFPEGTIKLLSCVADDYIEGECTDCTPDPMNPTGKPGGNPNKGGTPGTPVVKQEVLVDQVAEAA